MKRKAKLPAGIRQRTDSSWQIRYYAKDADGKPKRVVEQVFGTLSDAKQRRLQRLSEIQRGLGVVQSQKTVREFLDAWFADNVKKRAAYTTKRYRTLAQNQVYPRVGDVPVTKLTGSMLRALYAELEKSGGVRGGPLSSTTVTQAHHILHAALRAAVPERVLAVNPADHCEPPRPNKPHVEFLESADLERLIRGVAAGPSLRRMYVPTLLGGVLGMRRGETLGLKWSDVNFEASELMVARSLEAIRLQKPEADPAAAEPGTPKALAPGVRLAFKPPKSGKARKLVIPAFVLEALRVHRIVQKKERLAIPPAQRQDGDLVVCCPVGSPWNPESFSPRFISAAKAVGFPSIHYHVLRHTAISVLIKSGPHPKVVQEFAGHHSSAFTMDRYGHVARAFSGKPPNG